jgi:Conjugative transposon protein TcpC
MIVRPALHGRPARTHRELLARLGRGVLWLAVLVVVLRGVAGIVATPKETASARRAVPAPVWPDDAARALAAAFAASYLRVDPGAGVEAARAELADLAAPEILDRLTEQLDVDVVRQRVLSVTPAGVTRLDGEHALITVAAEISGTRPRRARLTVPVARDESGGLVVYDLPSLGPAPERASAAPPEGTPILGAERTAIGDVVTRFLRAYVSGDRAGLAYLVPAGTRIGATAGGFELLDLGSLSTIGPDAGSARLVLATVRVRDRVSRASYALRYRVRLLRRDRWYVAAINDSKQG